MRKKQKRSNHEKELNSTFEFNSFFLVDRKTFFLHSATKAIAEKVGDSLSFFNTFVKGRANVLVVLMQK